MSRIAFFEIGSHEREFLQKSWSRTDVFMSQEPFQGGNLPDSDKCEVLSVFIHSPVSEQTIAHLPNLKLVATRSTGYDHIALDYCASRGIFVSNVPVYGDNTVAEHTFALILALSRKVIQAHNRARTGDFSLDGLRGFDLRGRTIGIIGTGHIGVHVIRIARGFMMKVLAFDARPDKRLADALDFEYADSVDSVLEASDIVTLHVPLIPATHHLINRKNVYRMKKGAILINTARGGIVETEALLEAINAGHLGGAGLDVFEGEALIQEEKQLLARDYNLEELKTLIKNLALLRHENVIVTPHVAFNSIEAFERILLTTIRNILAFEAGSPQNVVR